MSPDPAIQARYEECRRNGSDHDWARMLAFRRFPGIRTDSTFNAGRVNGNQFEKCPAIGDYYRRQADAAGVSTTGKFYMGQLARFPGDPRAWVADRGDVLRIAREDNLTIEGAVSHQGYETAPRPGPAGGIDPAIVEEEVRTIVAANPDANVEDLREQITKVRSGQERFEKPYVEPSSDLVAAVMGED